jgi:hypothetical protein
MKRLIRLLALLIVISINANAQYKTGFGLRGGFSQGLTVKHFFNENTAINGQLSSRGSEGAFVITALLNKHATWNELFQVNKGDLTWFYGYGGHLGAYGKLTENPYDGLGGGFDGSLGMEYAFEQIPFSIALDYRLIFDVGFETKQYKIFQDPAFSIRYTIK